jgi:hypothetical protein
VQDGTHDAIERTRSRIPGDNGEQSACPEAEVNGGWGEEGSSKIETAEIGKVRVPTDRRLKHILLTLYSAQSSQLDSPLFKIPGELRNQASCPSMNQPSLGY